MTPIIDLNYKPKKAEHKEPSMFIQILVLIPFGFLFFWMIWQGMM